MFKSGLQSIRSYLHRVADRQKSLREGRECTTYEIAHDSIGVKVSWLTLENETGQTAIEWHNVVAAFAFKRDLWAVDSIRLCFSLSDDTTMEISEEMEGWEPLVRQLPEYLEGCERFDGWFETVALPPFETNWTQIYRRVV